MDFTNGTHIIRFTADWCGPCKVYAPIFDQAAADYPNITIHVVDIDKDAETTTAFNVMSIPYTVITKDGKTLKTMTGVVPKVKLKEFIDSALQATN